MRRLSLCLFLALLPAVLPAQTPTGVIQGLVTDASGAVVPQAKIVVVNIATNETREVRTDEAGRYVVPYLLPGFYHVTAEGTGFRPVRQENIKLDVGQNRTISFQLEVGAVTQEIRVDAAPPPVDLNNATVSQVVENKRIVDLPLNGRSAFALAGLSPGVNPTGGGATPHISGSQTSTSEVQIDGTTTVTAGVIGGMNRRVYEPQVDAVEEFSVQVNGLSAEFGRFAGGVINAVTKSGTNKLHGSAYDFLRNQKLDANNFFANRAGRPKGPFKRNQWGGTVGGPVYLPKLYDGRDKTFFFVGFEGTNARSQSVYTGTVPIAAWRGGDFSDLRSSGGTPIIIYDPLTGRPDPANPARFIRDPFTGNRVPQNRFDVTAVNAMKFFPQPNATPVNAYTNANNYVTTGAVPSDSYRTDIRGDHNWTENWRMFLRVSLGWSKSTPLYSYGNAATPTDGSGPSEGRSRSVTLDQVFTFSPTLIGNLRYGLGRLVSDRMPFGAGFDVTSLGFPKYLDESAARNIRIFPKMSFSGAVGDLGQNHTRAFEASLTHNLNFSVTKILSRHNFKFGGEYRKFYVNYYQFCCSSSNFSFSPNWTQQEISTTSATAGHPLASFLLGLPAGGSASHTATTTVSSSYWAGYIQDDWKLTSRLTLNLGLRFEVEAPRTDRFNNLSYFNLYDPSPLAGKVPASACRNCGNLAGNMYFVDENNRRQLATNWSNIGPRIGFAFAMDSKTSFRGGYGIMYPPSPATAGGASIGVAGFSGGTSFIGTLDSMRTVKTYMRDPFPDGFNYPQARAGGAEQFLGFGAGDSVFDGNGSPYVQQWNFTIQRSLPGSWVIEAGYLGSRGIKLIDGDSGGDAGDPLSQLRAEDMQLGNELLRVVPNPFFGLITSPTSALSARTVEYRQLLRPYPHYSDISIHRRPQAQSTYHAMTLRAERRFAQGLSFLLAYTAGKSIDDGSAVAWWEGPTSRSFLDHYNRPLERSVSSWDVAQRAIISFVYEFPFGKGKPLLADLPKGLNMLVSGWQTNGILTFQSGTPVMVTVPVNNTFIYTRSQRANSVPGKSARITGGTTDERLLKWFDTSIFSAPPSFTFGQVGRTLPDVRNPGNRLVDLSFFKNTYFGPENRLNLQYRLEMFGAFNTPQFGAPGASVGASNFGVISSAGGARQIQMALKLLW